jgi:hypothetical protein
MKKRYVVKHFETGTYYCGEFIGWSEKRIFVEYFDSIEEAEMFLEQEQGRFQIELLYDSYFSD